MYRYVFAILAFAVLFVAKPVEARVLAHVKLSEQKLYLYVDGEQKHIWKISGGKHPGWTRTGTFRPYLLSRHHRSSLFRGAPMPYAVFYDSHWAIHGTNAIKRLGSPASHGCVRLHPKNAAIFFNLVQTRGKKNTVVWIEK